MLCDRLKKVYITATFMERCHKGSVAYEYYRSYVLMINCDKGDPILSY